MGDGRGGGEGKISLPASFVCLQNLYTRWTGAMFGVVGCKLIDTCQSKVLFLSNLSNHSAGGRTCDLERKWQAC